MSYCAREVPQFNTISVSGYHIREAGSTALEEIAFTLSNGKAYLHAARQAGIDIDTVAPRMSFFWNAHNDLFEEIAKFRAARYLWAHIARDDFGCKDPRSHMLRFHTQTAGSTLTAQEPENNVVRVTLQALAAVLGGTQSLHTNAKDEALALPTANAAKLALRTQQIIGYESGVADVVDPLAGSYYVETLTNELIERARSNIREVDEIRGSIAAIESRWMQSRIADSAYRAQQAIESGEQVVVGVNKFVEPSEQTSIPLQRVADAVELEQAQRVARARSSRNTKLVNERLNDVRCTAKGTNNLMPAFVDAVDAGATLGEVCNVLREVFGVYRASEVLA
jgi:methylmalonyl-CoA mutase N-terminal domain/subunit